MKKLVVRIISYALIIVGFVFLASKIGKLQESIFAILPFIKPLAGITSMIIAAVLIVVGLILGPTNKKGKGKKAEDFDEVPIFEGHGKGKKLVGYKKLDK